MGTETTPWRPNNSILVGDFTSGSRQDDCHTTLVRHVPSRRAGAAQAFRLPARAEPPDAETGDVIGAHLATPPDGGRRRLVPTLRAPHAAVFVRGYKCSRRHARAQAARGGWRTLAEILHSAGPSR